MKKSTRNEMRKRGWSVVKTTMTIHDVPFLNDPEEVLPTEKELEMLRNNFDSWMEKQGSIPFV